MAKLRGLLMTSSLELFAASAALSRTFRPVSARAFLDRPSSKVSQLAGMVDVLLTAISAEVTDTAPGSASASTNNRSSDYSLAFFLPMSGRLPRFSRAILIVGVLCKIIIS